MRYPRLLVFGAVTLFNVLIVSQAMASENVEDFVRQYPGVTMLAFVSLNAVLLWLAKMQLDSSKTRISELEEKSKEHSDHVSKGAGLQTLVEGISDGMKELREAIDKVKDSISALALSNAAGHAELGSRVTRVEEQTAGMQGPLTEALKALTETIGRTQRRPKDGDI